MHKSLVLCSDSHGTPPRAHAIGAAASLHAGDIYERMTGAKGRVWKNDYDGLEHWLETLAAPLFIVVGNHDGRDPVGIFSRARDLTGKAAELLPGLWVLGIGWHGERHYDLPCDGDLARVLAGLRAEAASMPAGCSTLLLTHYPHFYPSVQDAISTFRPLCVIEGHLHDRFGTQREFNCGGVSTLVVNPGPAGMVLNLVAGSVGAEPWQVESVTPLQAL